MTEICIRCGKPTIYDTNTPVSDRLYFIEGSGQLCQSCYEVIYGEECQASLYSSDVPARISPDEGEKDKTGEAEVPEEPEEQTGQTSCQRSVRYQASNFYATHKGWL